MTPSEEVQNKFKQIERVSDDEGRVLGFRRLRLMERVKVEEFFPKLEDRSIIVICASCCEIDDAKIPFARTREELEAMVNKLEMHGLAAGTQAMRKLYGVDEEAKSKTDPESESDKAKN